MIKVISFDNNKKEFVPVDDWICEEEDRLFKETKDYIILPVSQLYGMPQSTPLDYFNISSKKSYNNQKMRVQCVHYLNYFEKFYDEEKELAKIYAKIKFLIDTMPGYDQNALMYDLKRYILHGMMLYKINIMNIDNYNLNLKFRSPKASLQYTNKHGLIMLQISLIMKILIPILTHFISIRKIPDSNHFLLQVYDYIIYMFDMDLYSKLYETSMTNVTKSKAKNPLWNMQSIRGINATTHSLGSVQNIILTIMPKYNYRDNIVHFNLASINHNIRLNIC